MQSLISDVSLYVLGLITNKLPSTLTFHNVAHTVDVVEGVHEICLQTGVPAEQAESVEIAAWFHDTGYLKEYIGHEEASIQIAKHPVRQLLRCSNHFLWSEVIHSAPDTASVSLMTVDLCIYIS